MRRTSCGTPRASASTRTVTSTWPTRGTPRRRVRDWGGRRVRPQAHPRQHGLRRRAACRPLVSPSRRARRAALSTSRTRSATASSRLSARARLRVIGGMSLLGAPCRAPATSTCRAASPSSPTTSSSSRTAASKSSPSPGSQAGHRVWPRPRRPAAGAADLPAAGAADAAAPAAPAAPAARAADANHTSGRGAAPRGGGDVFGEGGARANAPAAAAGADRASAASSIMGRLDEAAEARAEVAEPPGLWGVTADACRVYVSDSRRHRVHAFQVRTSKLPLA